MNNLYRFLKYSCLVVMSIALTAGAAYADIVTFTAYLSGNNEVPPVTTAASGIATVIIDTENGSLGAIPFHLEFSGLSSAQTAAHIHSGSAGVNGPPVITLPLGSPVDTTVAMTLADYANLAGGNLYVNVHTTNYPGGEIRGQLELTSTVPTEPSNWGSVKALYR
jgi:hypothetical protein